MTSCSGFTAAWGWKTPPEAARIASMVRVSGSSRSAELIVRPATPNHSRDASSAHCAGVRSISPVTSQPAPPQIGGGGLLAVLVTGQQLLQMRVGDAGGQAHGFELVRRFQTFREARAEREQRDAPPLADHPPAADLERLAALRQRRAGALALG